MAERDLEKLPRSIRKTLLRGCRDIFDDWGTGKVLTGSLAAYRVHRVGVYRIIYVMRESTHIEIVAIGHRKGIYGRKR